ncbi:venom peptide SjAPI-like [Pleurodeles waltl]|uniref:venom peptide SjAPI-like n=1 Tax=Pleurodeles waltl TaxID=8319 RepID=UPI0037095E2E
MSQALKSVNWTSLIVIAMVFITCTCRANMHFKNCGSGCPVTCGQRGKFFSCTKPCVARCACNDGYLMEDLRLFKCVPRDHC